MLNSFHNTTSLSGLPLAEAEIKAVRQEVKILSWLLKTKRQLITAEDVWKNVFVGTQTPLTSVRRALSNLQKDGSLIIWKDMTKLGMYGAKIHYYQVIAEKPCLCKHKEKCLIRSKGGCTNEKCVLYLENI